MRTISFLLAMTIAAGLLAGGPVYADSGAIRTMANIAMNMNHFPSDEDKAALKTIIDSDDASDEEAEIALAMSNMEHKLSEEDAERLQDIVDDPDADEDAQALARVLLGFNHSAGSEAKATLAALAAN